MGLPEIATIGSTILGIGGSLFGGKKKKTEYTSTKSPSAQGLENMINQYYQSMMGKPSPYAPMNSMSLSAANLLSNAYLGTPYTQYGLQQFNPQTGMMGQPQMGGMGQMQQRPQPQGFMNYGMPMYLPQMLGGGNIPRQQ